MKVFWFTNITLPELAQALGRKPPVVGGWMSSLATALRERGEVDLAVAAMDRGVRSLERHVVNGTTYFLLPPVRPGSSSLPPVFVEACSAALRAFQPDIIHVHGTENPYGLYVAQETGIPPAVISLQGLMHVYCRHVRGGLSLGEMLDGGLPGLLCWMRFGLQEAHWERRGRVEEKIIRSNRYFMGRTDWDRSHVLAINPSAIYWHVEEMMRPEFYPGGWYPAGRRRYSLFCTAAHSPLKGFHWLLYAAARLKVDFPDIHIRVADAPWGESGGFGYYGRYLKALIDKHGLTENLTALPALSADAVAQELRSAHAFVIPSLIENSPNALAEAMLVGTPCIAAAAGGIPSMVADGETALTFPPGDIERLADCIRAVFQDDSLAARLSSAGRTVAQARHSPHTMIERQTEVYRHVMGASRC